MKCKVSIIVPFYNTDLEYFKKCLKSIINQTYTDFEVIIVDDGSNNEYLEKLDELCKLDDRFRIIHKINGGVSSARNLGIKESKGDYIAFIDSDDWVEPTYIETLVKGIEDNNVQLSIVGVVYENHRVEHLSNIRNDEFSVLNKSDVYYNMLTQSCNIHGYLCNKLFKKSLIKIKLNENYHYCEDLVFCVHYLKNINYAFLSSSKLYHYRIGHNNSTGNLKFSDKIMTLIDAYKEVEKVYNELCPEKRELIRLTILKQAININARYKIDRVDNIEKYNILKKYILEYWDAYCKANLLEKLNIKLTYTFPVTFSKIKRFIIKFR